MGETSQVNKLESRLPTPWRLLRYAGAGIHSSEMLKGNETLSISTGGWLIRLERNLKFCMPSGPTYPRLISNMNISESLFSARRPSPTPVTSTLSTSHANPGHPADVVRQHGLCLLPHCAVEIITLGSLTELLFTVPRILFNALRVSRLGRNSIPS